MTNLNSEADMGYIRDFVQKIADALVSATELPKQIEAMKLDLTTLHADLDKTKQRNIELDALVGDIRRQRDEAEQNLSQIKATLNDTSRSLDQATNEANGIKAQLEHFRSELERAKQERDDYGLKHMAAEDRAAEAEAKLAKLADALGLPKPKPQPKPQPKPEPAPQPVEVAQPQATPFPSAPPAPSWAEPTPVQATVTEPTPQKRVYEGEFGFNELSHSTEQWDNAQQRYYRTA